MYTKVRSSFVLIIAPTWNQPRCPSTNKWTSCCTPIPWNSTREMKDNLLILATTWMNLHSRFITKLWLVRKMVIPKGYALFFII